MKKLFIIDLMPFLYKGYFVFLRNPRMTSTGINTSALLGLAGGLSAILRKEKPTHAVLAMDPGGPTFRHQAYAPYKAQREKMPEDLAASIPYAFELAEALRIPVVRVDGFEADDVMGTLAVKGAEAGFDVYMATPDKDAAQLVRPGVSLYRPAHAGDAAVIYDEAGVCEHWHLKSPLQMIDYLALAGDTADNIPGVRGVGEKTAAQLLGTYSTVEEIIENAPLLKGKLSEKIANGAEDAKISKFLTTIRTDVPITPDWEKYRLDGVDREKLSAVCAKFELTRLAREFDIASAPLAVPSSNEALDGRAHALDASASASESSKPAAAKPSTLKDVAHDYRLVSTEEEAQALAAELSKFDVIAFDTETAAAGGHQSTEAHFARLVGFSFAVAPGRAWYVQGGLVDMFRGLFADPGKTFIAHNSKFDRSVLLRYGIGIAGKVRDTMLEHYCLDAAARHGMDTLSLQYLNYSPIPITALIGEKERGKEQLSMAALPPDEILDYAAEDADVALRLDGVLRTLVEEAGAIKALDEVEEPLVKILIDMEKTGVKLDVKALKEYSFELDKEIMGCMEGIMQYAGPLFNPDSPRQLADLLFSKLSLPSSGVKKTQTGQYSTDEKTLSRLVGAHPVIDKILDYRACAKLKSTYVDKLPQLIDEDSRVHTTYSQAFTETGRLSSSDPNLQNIPIRTERGRHIRKAFIPRDENHVIVSADYSQIELRLMAAFSKDEAMLAAFRNGEDIHRDTASRVYGIMPALVTPEQRSHCKMVNFGIIYGMSAFGLSERLKISRREAVNLIDTYFSLYPRVREYRQTAIDEARRNGFAKTAFGRRRTLRDINSRNATARQAAERDAINTPIQGSAADLIKIAMVKVDRALKAGHFRSRMVLQIHDELVFDAPKDEADRLMETVRREMVNAWDFGVPLEVGISAGANWFEAH